MLVVPRQHKRHDYRLQLHDRGQGEGVRGTLQWCVVWPPWSLAVAVVLVVVVLLLLSRCPLCVWLPCRQLPRAWPLETVAKRYFQVARMVRCCDLRQSFRYVYPSKNAYCSTFFVAVCTIVDDKNPHNQSTLLHIDTSSKIQTTRLPSITVTTR